MSERHKEDMQDFYSILDRLRHRLGGSRKLAACNGRMSWPKRGVYFFFDDGEARSNSGIGPRVVRVGTHALTATSRTSLWHRLSQHRGVERTGGGNHRGSVFRRHVGTALTCRDPNLAISTWGAGNNASSEIRGQELALEQLVSQTICAMPFLWIDIDDLPGPDSARGYLERNAIALLSNFRRPQLDPPSADWLGHFCSSERVRTSGLWNSNHVDEIYDPGFLKRFDDLVLATTAL